MPHRSDATTANRTWALPAVVLLTALLLPVSAPTTARAQEALDLEALGVEVEVGFDGGYIRGRWMPVTVALSPTRLFAGTVGVVASTANGTIIDSREVEVSAGSTKVFRFVLAPSHDLTVQLVESGSDGLTVRPDRTDAQAFLVGVLGDALPAALPPVSSVPLDERGDFVPVSSEWLERSSRALDPLSSLVVTADQLASLSDPARRALVAAVGAGTDLVVTVSTPGAIDLGLPWAAAVSATATTIPAGSGATVPARSLEPAPGAWALTGADLGYGERGARTDALVTASNAGRGRLIVSGVGLGDGELGVDGELWGRVLQPTVESGRNFEEDLSGRLGQIAGEGLRSDSFSLPPIPLIVSFLVAYLLVVGPLNGVVLARIGRRELAWVTIPALTVVFSAGAFLAAAGTESGIGLSGRAAYWIDGAGSEVSAVALRAPRPGEHELTLPGGDWDVMPGSWTNIPSEVDRRSGDTVVRSDLEALQVGTAIGIRDVAGDAPLSLDLDPIPGGVRATVSNRSSSPLEGVTLRAGTIRERLGDLAPGATLTGELTRDTLPVVREWHDSFAGLRQPDGTVSAPRSLEALLRFSVMDGNPGVVWATATTTGAAGAGLPMADGDLTDDQGSFVAVGVTPGSLGSDTQPWEVDRDFVTTGFGNGWRPGPLAVEGRLEAVLRFRFPYEGTPGGLISSLDRGELQGQFELLGENGRPQFLEQECRSIEVRDEAGDLVRVQEVCAPVDAEGELVDPSELEAPPCPPEADSCQFDGRSWTFCFPGGVCEGGEAGRNAFNGVEGLEIYDFVAGAWEPVTTAFGDDLAGSLRLLSPLGETYVRVVGELHPFDYSGRGLQIVNGDA